MKKEKYYTPKIEEFIDGLEFEVQPIKRVFAYLKEGGGHGMNVGLKAIYYEDFEKCVFKNTTSCFLTYRDGEDFINSTIRDHYIKDKKIRVKYLDKDDVESLGFDLTKTPFTFMCSQYIDSEEFTNYYVTLSSGLGVTIGVENYCNAGFNEKRKMDFVLKNKSELIFILERLGWKKD